VSGKPPWASNTRNSIFNVSGRAAKGATPAATESSMKREGSTPNAAAMACVSDARKGASSRVRVRSSPNALLSQRSNPSGRSAVRHDTRSTRRVRSLRSRPSCSSETTFLIWTFASSSASRKRCSCPLPALHVTNVGCSKTRAVRSRASTARPRSTSNVSSPSGLPSATSACSRRRQTDLPDPGSPRSTSARTSRTSSRVTTPEPYFSQSPSGSQASESRGSTPSGGTQPRSKSMDVPSWSTYMPSRQSVVQHDVPIGHRDGQSPRAPSLPAELVGASRDYAALSGPHADAAPSRESLKPSGTGHIATHASVSRSARRSGRGRLGSSIAQIGAGERKRR
jgi:hypothetical protein